MKIVIDRFEGDSAVVELENKRAVSVPREILPVEAREGDVISIVVEKNETERRRGRIDTLMKDVWAD
ncbi:MAG: DUF3006 domain-containing protein [Clostridiales bacterium]|nr:DUF3006 domain-containing protein [Clostridiales bacterium]